MAPKRPAQPRAASRGSLSARQWQDLRQAARLARSEGVTVTWRRDGTVLISPHTPSANAGIRQQQKERAAPDAQPVDMQPMDTVGSPRQPSKIKQTRDAERAEADRALRASPFMARWKLLITRQLWTTRKATCDAVWTAWMRRRQVVRKLRSLLWREWTRRHIEPSAHIGPSGSRLRARYQGLMVLGLRSCRDDFILGRARAFAKYCSGSSRLVSGWLRQHADMADHHELSPRAAGLTTPVPKARTRKTHGGRGGRGSGASLS